MTMDPMLDDIAAVLTTDVLTPFVVPARPMLLGSRAAYCIRPGYIAREATLRAAGEPVRAHLHPTVLSIVERLTQSFGADRVRTSHGELPSHAIPHVLVRDLAASLGAGDVLVLSTTVRTLDTLSDHPGPPDDPAHYREWTFPELHAFLDAEGLNVAFGGLAVADSAPDSAAGAASDTAVMIAVGTPPSLPRRAP